METQEVRISLAESCQGTSRSITIPGTGIRGQLRIPAGILDGETVSFTARDTLHSVKVRVQPDDVHQIEGRNLRRELRLKRQHLEESGITLDTPREEIKLLFNNGTWAGNTWTRTLKGWGIPDPKGKQHGDLIVTAHIEGEINWGPLAPIVGFIESLFATAIGIAIVVAMFIGIPYAGYFVVTPAIDAASRGEGEAALDIVKWNLTHFPPSNGAMVRCLSGDLNTPAAVALKRRAYQIGRELEDRHGIELTDGSNIAVVRDLGGHAGLAHQSWGWHQESCIQIALGTYDADTVIRHEWAHIAAGISDWHGPRWRQVAADFGADPEWYAHCGSGDEHCQRRD